MTPDEKIEMLKLLQAKKRLAEDRVLADWTPGPIQRLILMAGEKIVCILGATRSGKTEVLAVDALTRSTGVIPKALEDVYPREFIRHGNVWLSAIDYGFMRDAVQEKINKLIPRHKMVKYKGDDHIYHLDCKCEIGLKSMDKGWMSYEGASRVYMGFDEEHDKKVFDSGYMRTTDCQGLVRMAFSPLKGITWAYNECYLKAGKYYYTINKHNIPEGVGLVHTPEEIKLLKDREVKVKLNTSSDADQDIVVFQMTVYDNIHLPDVEIQKTEKRFKDDQVLYNARILGNFAKFTGHEVFGSGLIYKLGQKTSNEFTKGDIVGGKFVQSPRGALTLFKPVEWLKEKHFVIGADLSEGLETGDPSCAQILNHMTGEQVGIWHGKVPLEQLPETLVELAKFFNNAWLAPERNFHGIGVVSRIREFHKYPFLYSERNKKDEATKQGEIPQARRYGWYTSQDTKPIMIMDLSNDLSEGRVRINDPTTVDEISTFIYHANHKLGAQTGCNDDRVIALAIANQVRRRTVPDISQPYAHVPEIPKDPYTGW